VGRALAFPQESEREIMGKTRSAGPEFEEERSRASMPPPREEPASEPEPEQSASDDE
jgi:hypothetical protein